MLTFNWPNFNHKQPRPQPARQTYISPETAQILQALQRGQRSQVRPMPAPQIRRPSR